MLKIGGNGIQVEPEGETGYVLDILDLNFMVHPKTGEPTPGALVERRKDGKRYLLPCEYVLPIWGNNG